MQKNKNLPLFQIYEVSVNGEVFFYGKDERDQVLSLQKVHNRICEENKTPNLKMRVWLLVQWRGYNNRTPIPDYLT